MQRMTIIGHLTTPVDIHREENKCLLRFKIAVNDSQIDYNTGETTEEIQDFEAVYWTSNAKIANELKKGTKIYVEGRIKPDIMILDDGNTEGLLKLIVNKLEVFTA
jgi:single-stranded DNA-binding protein